MSAPMLLSWCPNQTPPAKCDPCACQVVTVPSITPIDGTGFSIDFGKQNLCDPKLVWPFHISSSSAPADNFGDINQYNYEYPIGIALSPPPPPFDPQTATPGVPVSIIAHGKVTISYLGTVIATLVVTYSLAVRWNGFYPIYTITWSTEGDGSSFITISKAVAQSSGLASVIGKSTVDPETGALTFTGWAYDGPVDSTQEVIFVVQFAGCTFTSDPENNPLLLFYGHRGAKSQ